jgi:hypothetical protein
MDKNYEDIWKRWLLFLTVDIKKRKEILDAIHIEVKQGFDVVIKIAVEESEQQIENKVLFGEIKNFYEASLSLCVFYGYSLFLVDNHIDPIKENLLINSETNELGNRWMEEHEKDQHRELILKIDPILSLFLEKIKQDELNKMLVEYEMLRSASYRDVNMLDTFLNWSSHQGFILAMLEFSLIKKE